MSGRIALMVRGLPSIGIDEAVGRLGKYYVKPPSDQQIFHKSPSFTGLSSQNVISFLNNRTGDFSGGGGLNKQVMSDLRQLQKDFNDYVQMNQGIYTNSPTSASRAKLYRRVGFQDVADGGQVLDSRRISPNDAPYVKAIDSAVFSPMIRDTLNPNTTPAFVKSGDNVLAASRLDDNMLLSILRGQNIQDVLPEAISNALSSKVRRKATPVFDDFDYYSSYSPPQEAVHVPMARTPEEANRQMYSALSTGDTSMRNTIQYWARQNGLGDISEANANDIAERYWAQADDILF